MLVFRRYCHNYQRINNITNKGKPGDSFGIKGWIQNIRRLKNYLFLDVNDGSTNSKFQVVLPKNDNTQNLSAGSSISTTGLIQTAPNGNLELHAEQVKIISDGHITQAYPFVPKQQHPPEYVRDFLHLRTRIDYIAAMLRLRHKAQKCIHDYMDELGFVHINTPIMSTNDCEGAGEVFTVKPNSAQLLKEMSRNDVPLEESYFDQQVFLSVSGQLHLEAMCYGLGNTYTFSPAFRAENCKSPLHLSEFYMFEAEIAFMQELSTLCQFIEQLLKQVTARLLDKCEQDLSYCQQKAMGNSKCLVELDWLNKSWTTLSFDEAADIVQQNASKFTTEVRLSNGFSKEQELFIVQHCGTPVFIVNWPAMQKPFYMKVSRNNENYVEALDLLMPTIGELVGGSLREPDATRLSAHKELPKDLDWYLELRKYGGLPTGGFGMGFERFLQLLTGIKNIRDVIPFPRYAHSCKM